MKLPQDRAAALMEFTHPSRIARGRRAGVAGRQGLPCLVWIESVYMPTLRDAELGYVRSLTADIELAEGRLVVAPRT